MSSTAHSVERLAEEYGVLLMQAAQGSPQPAGYDLEEVRRLMVHGADWSPAAAEHLLSLARSYGSFMLRNALALSLALDVEDGALGF
jgi:hypothetical protein